MCTSIPRFLILVAPPAILAMLAILGTGSPPPDRGKKLHAGDEARPEVILRKFRQAPDSADRRLAQAAYQEGLAVLNRQVAPDLRWGPAYKAFCYSALLQPTSPALWHCAEALIGTARGMTGPEEAALRRAALAHTGMDLTSALVIDELDHGLTTEQRALAQRDRDCIAGYLGEHHGNQHRCGAAATVMEQVR